MKNNEVTGGTALEGISVVLLELTSQRTKEDSCLLSHRIIDLFPFHMLPA